MTEYQLPKAYDFKSTEPRVYAMWEKGGYLQTVQRSEQAWLRSRPRSHSSSPSRLRM